MEEKIFHRDEYPMDILGEFGLTQEMIYDLSRFCPRHYRDGRQISVVTHYH